MAEILQQKIQRDGKGRFLKGNPAGPGRQKDNQIEMWNKKFRTKSGRVFNRVFNALINRCLQGDTKAIIYLMDRLLGRMNDNVAVEHTIVEVTTNPEQLRQQFMSLFNKENKN
jgi:hypothetical protein